MSDEMIRRAAFLQSQAACAIVEAIAIMVNNQVGPSSRGEAQSVRDLIDKYGIGHNAALDFLNING